MITMDEVSNSIYNVMKSWFTPSCIFLMLNLIIGTIVITSRFANTQRKRQPYSSLQLECSVSSFLKDEPTKTNDSTRDPLPRAPSLLERLMSGNFRRIESGKLEEDEKKYESESESNKEIVIRGRGEEEEEEEGVDEHNSIGLDKATSFSLLEKVKSFNLSLCKKENNKDLNDLTRDPLPRAPSLLERLMSRNFRRIEPDLEVDEKKYESESEANRGRGEEEGVDAKADDFIKRFKQQLRLERLDSILRYHRN